MKRRAVIQWNPYEARYVVSIYGGATLGRLVTTQRRRWMTQVRRVLERWDVNNEVVELDAEGNVLSRRNVG